MMSCTHVTSRHVTSRHVTSRHVTSRHVTSRHVTSRHVTTQHVNVTLHSQPLEALRPPKFYTPGRTLESVSLQTILVGPPLHMQNVSLIHVTLTERWVDKQTNKQTNKQTSVTCCQVLTKGSFKGLEDVVKLLPGPCFEKNRATSLKGGPQ